MQLRTFLEAQTMFSKKNTCCNPPPPGGRYAYSQLLVYYLYLVLEYISSIEY